MSNNGENRKYEGVSVKLSPDQYVLLNAICDALGVNTYQIFQMFFYTLCKAAAPMHELSPEIRKIMTLMETDVGWANAFNLANPNHLHVAQAILILEQEGKKGFGAVMIDKPFMDKAPEKVDDIDPHRNDPQMTENVDYILERVTEVTMHGIYRRLRLMGGKMGCNNLSDVLLTMIDAQSIIELEEENRIQMNGEAQFSESGRRIEYGKRTKAKHHRTPDGEAMRQQRIVFTEEDATTTDMPDERPYGEKADEYMKNLEEQAKADEADDMEKEMGFKPFGQEW
jgi:hypothetical protein